MRLAVVVVTLTTVFVVVVAVVVVVVADVVVVVVVGFVVVVVGLVVALPLVVPSEVSVPVVVSTGEVAVVFKKPLDSVEEMGVCFTLSIAPFERPDRAVHADKANETNSIAMNIITNLVLNIKVNLLSIRQGQITTVE